MTNKEPELHGNTGRHGAMSVVLEVLKLKPLGLTSTQIAEFAIQSNLTEGDSGPETSGTATYHRIKRACDGLEKMGFIVAVRQTREGIIWKVVPGKIEEEMVKEAHKALEEFKVKMLKRIPLSDGARLLAAFEGVIQEESMRMALPPRPVVGKKAMEIKKTKPGTATK